MQLTLGAARRGLPNCKAESLPSLFSGRHEVLVARGSSGISPINPQKRVSQSWPSPVLRD